ncbi:hypothetical protein SLA2020_193790 [Shorea laevis]
MDQMGADKSHPLHLSYVPETSANSKCWSVPSGENLDDSKAVGSRTTSQSTHELLVGRGRSKSKKQRSKSKARRVRFCLAVYKSSMLCQNTLTGRKKKNCPSKKENLVEMLPTFSSGQGNQVAGDLVEDSGIENRNKILLSNNKRKGAKEIWEFARAIGVAADGNEEEVIKTIEAMENRDRATRRELMMRPSSNTGKGETHHP